MGVWRGRHADLAMRVRAFMDKMEANKCPLCGEETWDFDGLRPVFLIERSAAWKLGDFGRLQASGAKVTPERQIAELGKQLEEVGKSTDSNPLIQLSCETCGNTLLLDSKRVTGR